MLKVDLQLLGGRGATLSGGSTNRFPSSLAAFKENARQYNVALIEGKKRKAATIEYTDITGQTVRRYWDGGRYSERPSPMASQFSDMNGTYRAKFK